MRAPWDASQTFKESNNLFAVSSSNVWSLTPNEGKAPAFPLFEERQGAERPWTGASAFLTV